MFGDRVQLDGTVGVNPDRNVDVEADVEGDGSLTVERLSQF